MKIDRRVLKFLIVGGLAAFTEYVAFVLIFLIAPLITANTLSFCLGLLISFTLNRSWVFLATGRAVNQLMKYLALAGFNIATGNVLIYLITHTFEAEPAIAKISVMIMIASWNYLIFSKIIFKHS